MPPRAPGDPASVERRAAARGVAWGGVESAVSLLVGLVLTPFVVRACGLPGLGLWAASWSLAHTTGLLDLGVGASYLRFTSQAIALGDVGRLNRTLAAGTGFHLLLASLLVALALLFGPASLDLIAPGAEPAAARSVLGCALLSVLLRTTLSAYRAVVAGAQRIDLLGRIGAAVCLLEGIGAASALACGLGLPGMAINSLLWAACASGAEALTAHRLAPGLRIVPFRAGREEWRDLFAFGLRLQAVRAAEVLGAHAPRLALAAGAGLTAAGVYDLGARIASLMQIAALPLPVIQPLAGRLAARREEERLRSLLLRATRYVALLAFPCAALLVLDAGTILRAWTAQAVPPAASSVARLLSLSLAFGFAAAPLRLVLRGRGIAGPEALAAVCGSSLHVALALALAPLYGAPAAAAAALAGTLLSILILALGARRTAPGLGSAAARALPSPLLSAAGGLLAAAALRYFVLGWGTPPAARPGALLHLLVTGPALAAGSLLGAFLTGGLPRDEVASVLGAILPAPRERPREPAAVAGARGRP